MGSDSTTQAELKFDWMTPNEAEGFGIQLKEPVPESILCQFCNAKLYRRGLKHPFENRIHIWESNHERCKCQKSIDYWIKFDADQEIKRLEEEEGKQRFEFQQKVNKLFDQSKLGERFKLRTFSNYTVNECNKITYELAKKYAEDFAKYQKDGIGINFNGSVGSGKTHLAAAIANHLINKGIPVVFGTTMTLLAKIKGSYSHEVKESENEIIDLYSTVNLLIIDDFGKERINEWVLEKLYLIINSRYENNLPIIITTNYSFDQLKERLTLSSNSETAEAITSRFFEMCWGVEMNWEDYRKR